MEGFENTSEFQALVVAAAGKSERSMGDSVIPAEPPAWAEVKHLALKLCQGDVQHLGVLVHLLRAETNTVGFAGLLSSLERVDDQIANHWDTLLPEADGDDPDDPYYARVNILLEISEQPQFLDVIHRLPLVSARGIGEYSARDVAIFQGQLNGSEEDRARCQEGLIRGAFQESDPKVLANDLDTLINALECVKKIEVDFVEKSQGSGDISLEKLRSRLIECIDAFRKFATEFLPTGESVDNEVRIVSSSDDTIVSTPVDEPDVSTPSKLASRQAVMQAFSQITTYYQHHEPSSPVLFFVQSASSMVSKSFFDLLVELAPAHRDDLPTLLETLKKDPMNYLVQNSYQRFLSGESPASAHTENGQFESDQVAQSGPQNREQVLEILQDIERFFYANEPASPIPLLIAEMRKLVNKRFSDLLNEFSRSMPRVSNEQPAVVEG